MGRGSLFCTGLEALVIIIRFTKFTIVFAVRFLPAGTLCYKQGQNDPKLTLSWRVSFAIGQVMSLDNFIPGFALEKLGGIKCSF